MKPEIFRVRTQDTLLALGNYYQVMEDQLDNFIANFREESLSAMDAGKELAAYDIGPYNEFPRSMRYSFIVFLYLILENHLIALCDTIKHVRGLNVRSKEFKGDVIEQCKKYLKDIAGVPEINVRSWERIEDLSKVRNCIVHTLGRIDLSNDKKRLYAIAQEGQGLAIAKDDDLDERYIVFTKEYCERANNDVGILFNELFDASGLT